MLDELRATALSKLESLSDTQKLLAAGATGLLVGSTVGVVAAKVASSTKKKRKSSSKSSSSRKRSSSTKRKSRRTRKRQRKPYTAGKGKDRSTRRIRFTKNNQPYVIMANGRARFIKRSSVRRSRKRKGGRY